MKKKVNPAAARNGSEVGSASYEPWTHPDLKPLRFDLKPGDRYRAHTRFDGVDFEAPNAEPWDHESVTVEVVTVGPGWIDERTLTFNYSTRAVRPRGPGWLFEGPSGSTSSSWRRLRMVP